MFILCVLILKSSLSVCLFFKLSVLVCVCGGGGGVLFLRGGGPLGPDRLCSATFGVWSNFFQI